jgi:hypothetical protein
VQKLLIGSVVVLLIVVGGLFFVWSSLDGIVKTAIETYGSQATRTEISVDAVKLKPEEGAGSISGLNVGNPAGFTDSHIFKFGVISTVIDTSTVTKNPVVIDELIVSTPEVFYEINNSGISNVEALKKNLGSSSSESATSSNTKPASDGELKMIIRRFVVEGGKANMRIAALGDKQQSVTLPRIQLTDIGKKSGGATALELAQVLSEAMLKNVQGAVMGAGVQQYLGKPADEFKQNLQSGAHRLKDAAGSSGGQFGGAMNGLLGN